jgi:hypothetical protein
MFAFVDFFMIINGLLFVSRGLPVIFPVVRIFSFSVNNDFLFRGDGSISLFRSISDSDVIPVFIKRGENELFKIRFLAGELRPVSLDNDPDLFKLSLVAVLLDIENFLAVPCVRFLCLPLSWSGLLGIKSILGFTLRFGTELSGRLG